MEGEGMERGYREALLCRVADRTAVLLLADLYARLQLLDARLTALVEGAAGRESPQTAAAGRGKKGA